MTFGETLVVSYFVPLHHIAAVVIVSPPDFALCERKGLVKVKCFLGFCMLSSLAFGQAYQIAALCDFTFCCEVLYKVSCLGLVVVNQNAALQFYVPLCSNGQLASDRLHNIVVKSRACTTKKTLQCHQTFPHPGD